jgi:uncharacterized phage protein gp47/JayE
MSGIDSTGFVPKPLEDTKDDLESAIRASFGAGITTQPQSGWGQLIGIFSDRLADLWQLGQAVYNAGYPDGAEGVALDNLCALTGTTRLPASYSYVTVTASGTNGTVIGTTFVASVAGSGIRFVNQSSQTISGGTATLTMKAEDTGELVAPAGTLTVIETPIAGLTSITNAADQYTLGSDVESDAALRLRRALSLRAIGNAAVESIRAKVLEVEGVSECYVFENTTGSVDAEGLPAHSFEVVVTGSYADQDIWDVIWASKPAGIASYGGESGTVTDSMGVSHTLYFSEATPVDVHVELNIQIDPAVFPVGGDAAIKAAVAAYGDLNYSIGSTVISSALIPTIFAACAGIKSVALPKIGLSDPPSTTTDVTTDYHQIPNLDTGNIDINHV